MVDGFWALQTASSTHTKHVWATFTHSSCCWSASGHFLVKGTCWFPGSCCGKPIWNSTFVIPLMAKIISQDGWLYLGNQRVMQTGPWLMQLVLGGLCRGMIHTSTSLYAFLQLVAWPRLVGKYITYCNTYPILDWSWQISSANEEGLITIGCWEYRQSIFAVGSYHFLSSTTMD